MDWIIGDEWKCSKRGLSKKVLSINFQNVEKPTEYSTCRLKISNVANLENKPSSYLTQTDEFVLELGTATTPIDYYLEIILQNMLLGETSECQIQTKSGNSISFEITLNAILSSKYLFELTVEEVYNLAQRYRENGVKMFKSYPLFAQEYFNKAAKCLLSFEPLELLTKDANGMDGKELISLLQTLKTNIAACLINQQRFEEVLYLTEFVDDLSTEDIQSKEKAVYRRALAFFNIKAYEKALATINKIDGIQEKKEFLALYNRTKQTWKQEEEHYKSIVQRMFN